MTPAAEALRRALNEVRAGRYGHTHILRPRVIGWLRDADRALSDAQNEITGLRAALDEALGRDTCYVLSQFAEQVRQERAGDKPGLILRTTDTHEEWVLGNDQRWDKVL